MKYLMYDVTKHIIKVVNMCLLYTWWYGFWNLNSLLGILPRPTTIAFSEIKNVKMIHLLAFLILILYKNTQKSNYIIGKKSIILKEPPSNKANLRLTFEEWQFPVLPSCAVSIHHIFLNVNSIHRLVRYYI